MTSDTIASSELPGDWRDRAVSWMIESRSHRVICIMLGIWMLNGFDLAFTVLAHQQGFLQEANPLARQMLHNGIASIVLYKVGLVLIGSYPLLKFRQACITELGALVVLMSYMFLAFHWSLCYELYAVSASAAGTFAELHTYSTVH